VGLQPPKLSTFRIFVINLPLRGDSFAVFLRNSQHLYASPGSFNFFVVWSLSGDKQPSIFPLWGIELSQLLCRDDSTIVLVIIIIIIIIFPQIFNSPRGETTDRIKKVRGAKMGRISSISMPSMVGILGRAPAVDEKCDFFCFFCHALELRSL